MLASLRVCPQAFPLATARKSRVSLKICRCIIVCPQQEAA